MLESRPLSALGTANLAAVSLPAPPSASPSELTQAPPDAGRPLGDLVRSLGQSSIDGDARIGITAVTYRSDEAIPGSLFFCVPGGSVDGHDFAGAAVEAGAAALVVERKLPYPVIQVLVPSVREAMGPISAEFCGRPSERLTIVGVTGTNGKTTTTYLLESVFRAAGLVPGVIGTTGVRIDGTPEPFPRTTPEAPDLQRLLARMVERGVHAVAMEVSSHGLHQHRVGGIRFGCAVFTNLTQDHLDYHGTLEEYFHAKARLFDPAVADRAAVNWDSPEGRRLLRGDLPTLTYGVAEGADLRATDVATSLDGLSFRVGDLVVRSRLRGEFNVSNCLAALAAARSLTEHGRVIVAFGCGGDRDRGKRASMGGVATRLADLTFITSDNPRSEDPLAIVREIERGVVEGSAYVVEPDRRTAIGAAIREARAGDVVVIAGKGHETGQEFADRTIPFDDRLVAAEELRGMHYGVRP